MNTAEKFFAKLAELQKTGKFYGFSVFPTGKDYQVSMAISQPGAYRVRRAPTIEEGIELVLSMDFMDDDLPPMKAPPAVDEPPEIIEAAAELEAAKSEDAGIFD